MSGTGTTVMRPAENGQRADCNECQAAFIWAELGRGFWHDCDERSWGLTSDADGES